LRLSSRELRRESHVLRRLRSQGLLVISLLLHLEERGRRCTFNSRIASRSRVASSARSRSSSSIFLFSRSLRATVLSSSSISRACTALRAASSSEACERSLRASRSVFCVFWRSCCRSLWDSCSEFTRCQLSPAISTRRAGLLLACLKSQLCTMRRG
jgi:hypothetical protein